MPKYLTHLIAFVLFFFFIIRSGWSQHLNVPRLLKLGPTVFEKIDAKTFSRRRPPLWGTLLKRRLDQIKDKHELKPVSNLQKNPACEVRLFDDHLFHLYGTRFLGNDISGAGQAVIKMSGFFRCLTLAGMRELDHALSLYLEDLLQADPATRTAGIRAVINPVLLIQDLLLWTGWSESQLFIQRNLEEFQRALSDEPTDTFFCSMGNSVLQFNSSSGDKSILHRAVTVDANRQGELGPWFECSMCEMAYANFEGFCDRGFQEMMECMNDGGSTNPNGWKKGRSLATEEDRLGLGDIMSSTSPVYQFQGKQGGAGRSPSGSSAEGGSGGSVKQSSSVGGGGGGEQSSSSSGAGGESHMSSGGSGGGFSRRDLRNLFGGTTFDRFDPLHGMTETEFRAAACGLGTPGTLKGMIKDAVGNSPRGQCPQISREKAGVTQRGDPERLRTCGVRHSPPPPRGLQDHLAPADRDQWLNPLENSTCQLGLGNGRVDPSANVSYRNDEVIQLDNGTTVNVQVDIKVDDQNDFDMTVGTTHTNPSTGQTTPINADTFLDSGQAVAVALVPGGGSPSNTTRRGNLGDRNQNSRLATSMMNRARDQGNVRRAPNCAADTTATCSQSRVDQANGNEDARADEQKRQRQTTSRQGPQMGQPNPAPQTPRPTSGSGATNPGPDGVDTCTAEGRKALAIQDCTEREDYESRLAQLGPIGHDGLPLGWNTMPGGDGVGNSGGLEMGEATCFVNLGKNPPSSNNESGYTDSCWWEGDPSCDNGAAQPMAVPQDVEQYGATIQPGVVDPNPEGSSGNQEDACPQIPGVQTGGEGQDACGPSSGGGETD